MSRTIVITGARGDLARELVKLLPDDELILLSRSLSDLTELYGTLSNVHCYELSEQVAAEISVKFDRIEILINNAGLGHFDFLSNLTDAQIEQEFAVNAILPIKLARDLRPQRLVNIASIAGKVPSAKSSVYAASKAALIAFSDALRQENVSVLTVNTGPVKTKFHAENSDYLTKVGKMALPADLVARKIVAQLSSRKRELNLPWQLALVAKLRAIAPALIDQLGQKFFNYK